MSGLFFRRRKECCPLRLLRRCGSSGERRRMRSRAAEASVPLCPPSEEAGVSFTVSKAAAGSVAPLSAEEDASRGSAEVSGEDASASPESEGPERSRASFRRSSPVMIPYPRQPDARSKRRKSEKRRFLPAEPVRTTRPKLHGPTTRRKTARSASAQGKAFSKIRERTPPARPRPRSQRKTASAAARRKFRRKTAYALSLLNRRTGPPDDCLPPGTREDVVAATLRTLRKRLSAFSEIVATELIIKCGAFHAEQRQHASPAVNAPPAILQRPGQIFLFHLLQARPDRPAVQET